MVNNANKNKNEKRNKLSFIRNGIGINKENQVSLEFVSIIEMKIKINVNNEIIPFNLILEFFIKAPRDNGQIIVSQEAA